MPILSPVYPRFTNSDKALDGRCESLLNTVYLLIDNKKLESARDCLAKDEFFSSHHREILCLIIGEIFFTAERYDEAMDSLTNGLNCSCNESVLINGMAIIAWKKGDFALAKNYLDYALGCYQDEVSFTNSVKLHAQIGMFDELFFCIEKYVNYFSLDSGFKKIIFFLNRAWYTPIVVGNLRLRFPVFIDKNFSRRLSQDHAFYRLFSFDGSDVVTNICGLRDVFDSLLYGKKAQWIIDQFYVDGQRNCYRQVGIIGLSNIDYINKNVEVYVGVYDDESIKAGYPLKAMIALIDILFNDIGFHKISASVKEINFRFLKSIMSFGFSEEGFRRDSVYDEETNSWIGHYEFGLLANEFNSSSRLSRLRHRILKRGSYPISNKEKISGGFREKEIGFSCCDNVLHCSDKSYFKSVRDGVYYKICDDIDVYSDNQVGRVRQSRGTFLAASHQEFSMIYDDGAVMPSSQWDMCGSVSTIPPYACTENKGISNKIWVLKSQVKQLDFLYDTMSAISIKGAFSTGVNYDLYQKIIKSAEFNSNLAALLSNYSIGGDNKIIGFYIGKQRLNTTTINTESKKYLGLHVDNWSKHSLYNRSTLQNRICWNLGTQSRELLFAKVSFDEIYRVLSCSGGFSVTDGVTNIARIFLTRFPDYPIHSLIIHPGEAYIAPTEYIIHDGCSLNMDNFDITFSVMGFFKN